MSGGYESAVQQTFVNSLKSVFLVDDAFPTYSDMFGDADVIGKFVERDRAKKLYAAFRDKHLPCDIENAFTPGDLQMVERLRKCDLIVLDFHLDGEGGDNSKAIEILRKLADSRHFNTVVVYTKAALDQVWLDVAANLRPDLKLSPLLKTHEAETAWWDDVNVDELPQPTVDTISRYLTLGMDGVTKGDRAEIIKAILEKGGKDKGDPSVMAEMLIRSAIDKRRPEIIKKYDEADQLGQRSLQGRFASGKPYWLQCRGCFIALVTKSEVANEADALMKGLQDALIDWKPNFLQILVSEIQNQLELESVAADPKLFSEANRQVALSHYLLEELANNEDPESAVESIIDRIVETLRYRISGDQAMRKLAIGVLSDVRQNLGEKITAGSSLEKAAALAHVEHRIDANNVISFLNAFLSTETFSKSRITTGTVFRNGADFWMVATPACDLTSRVPGVAQGWMKSIHPTRAMIAIRLREADLNDALKTATHGRHAFVVYEEKTLCFSLFDKTTSTPDPEMFFTMDAGKVVSAEGGMAFRAIRVTSADNVPQLSEAAEYTVVGQLRPNYASRVLQLTGAHLSRIGIDFFNVGGNGDA